MVGPIGRAATSAAEDSTHAASAGGQGGLGTSSRGSHGSDESSIFTRESSRSTAASATNLSDPVLPPASPSQSGSSSLEVHNSHTRYRNYAEPSNAGPSNAGPSNAGPSDYSPSGYWVSPGASGQVPPRRSSSSLAQQSQNSSLDYLGSSIRPTSSSSLAVQHGHASFSSQVGSADHASSSREGQPPVPSSSGHSTSSTSSGGHGQFPPSRHYLDYMRDEALAGRRADLKGYRTARTPSPTGAVENEQI